MEKNFIVYLSWFMRDEIRNRELWNYHPVFKRADDLGKGYTGNLRLKVNREELDAILVEARLYADDAGYEYDLRLPYIRLRDQILKTIAKAES